jgi:hypothetical protein
MSFGVAAFRSWYLGVGVSCGALTTAHPAFIVDKDQPRPPSVLLPDHRFHLCLPSFDGFGFRVEVHPASAPGVRLARTS